MYLWGFFVNIQALCDRVPSPHGAQVTLIGRARPASLSAGLILFPTQLSFFSCAEACIPPTVQRDGGLRFRSPEDETP